MLNGYSIKSIEKMLKRLSKFQKALEKYNESKGAAPFPNEFGRIKGRWDKILIDFEGAGSKDGCNEFASILQMMNHVLGKGWGRSEELLTSNGEIGQNVYLDEFITERIEATISPDVLIGLINRMLSEARTRVRIVKS